MAEEKEAPTSSNAKALTITFLTPVSFASLNGSDKEAENISNIKKLTRGTESYPYVSAQAVRRALRDQLATLGEQLSEGQTASIAKGAATTLCQPDKYIDDDLFGFMKTTEAKGDVKGTADKRTAPLRVSPLLALDKYEGDLDFGTNYMSVDSGGNPNIFETEIHAGLYRGTILLELDRVGCGEGFTKANELNQAERCRRVVALVESLQNLWSSGRQARFLADLSPKFVAAAVLRVKNPIFLESVLPNGNGGINAETLTQTVSDFQHQIIASVFGARSGFFTSVPEGTMTVGQAFDAIGKWIKDTYPG